MNEYWYNLALMVATLAAVGSAFGFAGAVAYLIPEGFKSGWPLVILMPPLCALSSAYLVTFA